MFTTRPVKIMFALLAIALLTVPTLAQRDNTQPILTEIDTTVTTTTDPFARVTDAISDSCALALPQIVYQGGAAIVNAPSGVVGFYPTYDWNNTDTLYPTLSNGTFVLILSDPVCYTGYRMFQVQVANANGDLAIGWVKDSGQNGYNLTPFNS